MRTVIVSAVAAVLMALSSLTIAADDFQPLEGDEARRIAQKLVEEADKLEKPQIKIEADCEKANGVHSPGKAGILVVPQKELTEGEELAAKFKTEQGASLAYLFMYHIVPVVNGRTLDASQLRSVKFRDEEGAEHTVYVMLLAVRQNAEDDYRLHAYGHADKPLVDSKFAEGTGPGAEPVAVEIKDPNATTQQGKLVVTVFGKYQASFQCVHRAD